VQRREDLLRTIAAWHLPVPVTDDTSLVRSGLLDSLALFRLVLWVEEQTGRPLDPTQVNIRADFDSVASILRFVDGSRQHDPGRG
jgi:acyl carrier protein